MNVLIVTLCSTTIIFILRHKIALLKNGISIFLENFVNPNMEIDEKIDRIFKKLFFKIVILSYTRGRFWWWRYIGIFIRRWGSSWWRIFFIIRGYPRTKHFKIDFRKRSRGKEDIFTTLSYVSTF